MTPPPDPECIPIYRSKCLEHGRNTHCKMNVIFYSAGFKHTSSRCLNNPMAEISVQTFFHIGGLGKAGEPALRKRLDGVWAPGLGRPGLKPFGKGRYKRPSAR